jgi:hypothetical protein
VLNVCRHAKNAFQLALFFWQYLEFEREALLVLSDFLGHILSRLTHQTSIVQPFNGSLQRKRNEQPYGDCKQMHHELPYGVDRFVRRMNFQCELDSNKELLIRLYLRQRRLPPAQYRGNCQILACFALSFGQRTIKHFRASNRLQVVGILDLDPSKRITAGLRLADDSLQQPVANFPPAQIQQVRKQRLRGFLKQGSR